jgi:hypothetical protein
MKKIEFTPEELGMLQSVIICLEPECEWVRLRDTNLFKCEVLMEEKKLNFDTINSLSDKLFKLN